MLLLDADAASGFVREWTPNVMPPARHRAYAFQWFAFALAALVIFIGKHWRKVEEA
jgi:cytochrome oxidase assembly protein ShyY1